MVDSLGNEDSIISLCVCERVLDILVWVFLCSEPGASGVGNIDVEDVFYGDCRKGWFERYESKGYNENKYELHGLVVFHEALSLFY